MEYEKLLPTLVSVLALLFSIFSFWRNRQDKSLETDIDKGVELKKAHLTESANFRAELRDEIKNLKAEIKDLKSELKRTEDELKATNTGFTGLQADFDRVLVEKKALERENQTLVKRVSELERQVISLRNRT